MRLRSPHVIPRPPRLSSGNRKPRRSCSQAFPASVPHGPSTGADDSLQVKKQREQRQWAEAVEHVGKAEVEHVEGKAHSRGLTI